MKTAFRTTVFAAALLLVACGGGGTAGGGGGGGSGSSQFSIGGSMSGLTAGSGVVLSNNGGDALTVSAGATSFAFSTPMTSGATYDVTVQTQPSGESCTVEKGSGTASANVTGIDVACASVFAAHAANVAALSVSSGPASSPTFNIPLVSVTVCQGGTCAQIPNILVDSGSEGLRVMASVLTGAGLTLTPINDPLNPSNTIHECTPFADGYAWGVVATATVKISGETTASAIPVQVIDDGASPNPAVPSSGCANGNSLDSVNALQANGVLGIGVFAQDCGAQCTTSSSNNVYWSCTSSGSCVSTTLLPGDQVENPVPAFTTDNNGAVIQLPAISTSGAQLENGYLAFGIGTESNNGLGSATVLTADSTTGVVTTSYGGQMLSDSIIDSGSNALFFPAGSSSPIALCSFAPSFYCPANTSPSSPLNLSAVIDGQNGATSDVPFQLVDLAQLSSNNFALDDVGGPAPNTPQLSSYFDWGVPFFYGRTVYLAQSGMSAGGTGGPYYAY